MLKILFEKLFQFTTRRKIQKSTQRCLSVVSRATGLWIRITAACSEIPPLIGQIGIVGRLIALVKEHGVQNLVLLEKSEKGIKRKTICEVLYIPLRGK